MTLKTVQRDVDDWIREYTPGYFSPLMMIARLTEELGELSRAVSYQIGEKRPKPGEDPGSVADEIGDVLFVLVCLANSMNLDMDRIHAKEMKKLRERDANRWKG